MPTAKPISATRISCAVPVAGLMDADYLAARSRLISPERAIAHVTAGTPPGAQPRTAAPAAEVPSTSHFVAVDAAGNVASYTSTIEGPWGSGLTVNGHFLNNELTDFSFAPELDGAPVANRVEGGKRPRSSMSPTIVYGPDGRVRLAVGAAGGTDHHRPGRQGDDRRDRLEPHRAGGDRATAGDGPRRPAADRARHAAGSDGAGAARARPQVVMVEPGYKANAIERMGDAGSARPIRAARASGWRSDFDGARGNDTGEPCRRDDAAARTFPEPGDDVLRPRAEKGDAPFLWAKDEGEWRSISWRGTAERWRALAAALKRLGLEPGDRVMLVSENRPEWLISDLAIMAAGCVTVPAYTTNTERDHQHILDDSGARAVIVSTQKLAKTLLPAAIRIDSCEHVIGIEKLPSGQESTSSFHDWAALVAAEARPTWTPARPRPVSGAATSPASSTPRAPAARRAA